MSAHPYKSSIQFSRCWVPIVSYFLSSPKEANWSTRIVVTGSFKRTAHPRPNRNIDPQIRNIPKPPRLPYNARRHLARYAIESARQDVPDGAVEFLECGAIGVVWGPERAECDGVEYSAYGEFVRVGKGRGRKGEEGGYTWTENSGDFLVYLFVE